MGRYRAPQKPGSAYITPEGAQKLREELQYLWKEKRPEITKSVQEAAAQGDRSENAEYIYGKKQLREIDSRVRFLSKRLDALQVIENKPVNQTKVYFGAWVELEGDFADDSYGSKTYRIVGPDEFDPKKAWISVDSPIARALIGKEIGAEISLELPAGRAELEIVAIRYENVDC